MNVTISISDDQIDAIDHIAARLTSAGLRIDQTLGEIGAITGSARLADIGALHDVPGVQHLEMEQSVSIAPPDSELQ